MERELLYFVLGIVEFILGVVGVGDGLFGGHFGSLVVLFLCEYFFLWCWEGEVLGWAAGRMMVEKGGQIIASETDQCTR